MVARTGPLATIRCKPRQAWKGAAVAMASCAEIWLVRATHPIHTHSFLHRSRVNGLFIARNGKLSTP